MKPFLVAATLVATALFASGASAQSDQMRAAVEDILRTTDTDVDVDTLTEAQLDELYLVATGTESASEKSERIEQILREAGTAPSDGD